MIYEINKTIPITKKKKNNILGNKSNKEMQHLHTENYKSLLKKAKDLNINKKTSHTDGSK